MVKMQQRGSQRRRRSRKGKGRKYFRVRDTLSSVRIALHLFTFWELHAPFHYTITVTPARRYAYRRYDVHFGVAAPVATTVMESPFPAEELK